VNDATPDAAACIDSGARPTTPTAIACSIGTVLADAARAADRDEDAAEIEAILQAMVRLLAGVPLRSDGKMTIKSLATEAGLRRNKLTHKHTGLKDLFYALVRSQDERPQIAKDLHAANTELADKVRKLTAERDGLRSAQQVMARVIHVLESENDTLRKALEASEGIADLRARRLAQPAAIRPY
jgi:hypothetical protein